MEPIHCHPSIILEKIGGFLTAWILIFISQVDNILSLFHAEPFDKKNLTVFLAFLGFMLLILLLIAGYQYFVWRKTWIYIDENMLIIERNTLNRKKNTYSISHISNINMEQNLFELLIHTYRMKIDMENATDANSTDISIVFSFQKAQELKSMLLAKKGISDNNENTTIKNAKNYASFSQILIHCLCSFSGFYLIFLLAISAFFGYALFSKTITLSELLFDGKEYDFSMKVLAIGFVILTYGYQIMKRLLIFYHFSIFRQGNEIMIHYGFFKKQDYILPVERIHAMRIVQAPIARLFHLYEARVICVGIGDSEEELTQLSLYCKKTELYQRLEEILPEFSISSINNIHRLPKSSGKLYISSFISWIVICCVFPFLVTISFVNFEKQEDFIFYRCLFGLMALSILLYHIGRYYCLGFYLGDTLALFSGGSLTKTITFIPYQNIQHLQFKQSLLSRWFQLFHGEAYILASTANRVITFPYMREAQKILLTEKVKYPQGT